MLTIVFAAAIAARISEQLQNRKGSRDIDDATTTQLALATVKATVPASTANINGEIYTSNGDFVKDIEVNDQRNRYIVTKTSTQKMVRTIETHGITSRLKTPPKAPFPAKLADTISSLQIKDETGAGTNITFIFLVFTICIVGQY